MYKIIFRRLPEAGKCVMAGAMILFITACEKTDTEDIGEFEETAYAIGSSADQPAIGENDGIPYGTALILPSKLKLVDRPQYRFNQDQPKISGFTRTFYVPLHFVNEDTATISFTIPPGLILNSQFRDNQNGLLVERVLVEVPPTLNAGGTKDTTTIFLAVSCINEGRTPPVSFFDAQYNIADWFYEVGPITADPNLMLFLKLFDRVTKLRVQDFIVNLPPEPGSESELDKAYNDIQLALWKITDGPGLTKGFGGITVRARTRLLSHAHPGGIRQPIHQFSRARY
jgi:hypothetical protein